MMDHGACNIVYLDRRAREELVRRDSVLATRASSASMSEPAEYFKTEAFQLPVEVQSNIESILSTFNEVHVCRAGGTCLSRLSELQASAKDPVPTIVLIDVPYDEEQRLKRLSREPRTPSPTSTRSTRALTTDSIEPGDIYGVQLLTHISSEIQSRAMSRMIIPIVVLSGFEREWASPNLPSPSVHGSQVLSDTVRLTRYLDAGAVDVLTSPLSKDHVHGLAVHAYRIYKEVSSTEAAFMAQKRNRKLSWVGVVDETKPYAYLREAMVSNLMGHICNPGSVGDAHDPSDIVISAERNDAIKEVIGTWSFSAHDFSDNELLHAAVLMLEHALQMPEVEKWRMSTGELKTFLLASKHAYNDFVLYHNFRHVVDVLQAVFYFLVQIGTIPQYPTDAPPKSGPPSAIASLLKPFDALTLLIAAIGHDVGHPGVNNAFLVALNAPLAQLYNDRSVLESFHCAAYSQILRRFWPTAFEDITMRKLMINSILATDMGLHFKYMSDLGNLQEKLDHNNNTLDGWSVKVLEEYRDLACGLLIKCADISNVARKFPVAAQWASILTDEFSNQGNMEIELNIPTQLFGGPPVLDNVVKMGESQIGFMNIFAHPLFEAVADILPAMQFSVDEILRNKAVWEQKIEKEKECANHNHMDSLICAVQTPASMDGMTSPMSRSHVELPETNAMEKTADEKPRGSTDDSTREFLVTQAPESLGDRQKKEKCGQRLRSLSPTKRKLSKSRDRSTGKQDQFRPRTSPANNAYDGSGNENGNGTPQIPSLRSQPDVRYGQMNGHTVLPGNGGASAGKTSKFYLSNSSTDVTAGPGRSRMSRFGLGKLWRKKFRASSAVQAPPPPLASMDDRSEGT